MPSPPRQNNNKSDNQNHHTSQIKNRGKGWHAKSGIRHKTAKIRGITTQGLSETTAEPEVRAKNDQQETNRATTRGRAPAGLRQKNLKTAAHTTVKGCPIENKNPNKRHYNTRVRRNNGRTRSEIWRWPDKKEQQSQKTMEPQRWTGLQQGRVRETRPQPDTPLTRAGQEDKQKN